MKHLHLAALSLSLLSCTEEKEIPTFRIADAKTETTPASPESKEPRPLRWVAPETWEEEKPGPFQVALYRIAPGITAAVSRFPGDAGGTAANVNRWRQQVGLAPSPDTGGEVIALAESDSQARWFELKGAEQSILAAIIPVDGETWFFKLESPTIALETARPGFMDFLKSTEIGSAARALTPVIDLRPPAGWQKQKPTPRRHLPHPRHRPRGHRWRCLRRPPPRRGRHQPRKRQPLARPTPTPPLGKGRRSRPRRNHPKHPRRHHPRPHDQRRTTIQRRPPRRHQRRHPPHRRYHLVHQAHRRS